jgi:RNA polymerase sigma-70 factor (ECF subfamily)
MWNRAVIDDQTFDREAVVRMSAGDPEGLSRLYDRHARAVYSLALRIVEDRAEAEDIVQDVFSQAWFQARRYDHARAPVAGWLLMMARSRAIDRLRSRRVRPDNSAAFDDHQFDAVVDPAPRQDLEAITAEQAGRVRNALEALPPGQRRAIELAYYEGLTHTEIAERLGEPLGTVKTRIRLGMLRLREALGQA